MWSVDVRSLYMKRVSSHASAGFPVVMMTKRPKDNWNVNKEPSILTNGKLLWIHIGYIALQFLLKISSNINMIKVYYSRYFMGKTYNSGLYMYIYGKPNCELNIFFKHLYLSLINTHMYWNEIQFWINFKIVQVYMELTISINLVQLLIVFNNIMKWLYWKRGKDLFQFNMFIPVKKVFSYTASIFNI